jgi:hypothetical protein
MVAPTAIAQGLVVVELDHERDLVGVLASHRADHAEGGEHTVASALDGQLDDIFGIEVQWVGRKGRAGRVLDALVYRQEGHVASAGQAAGVEQRLHIAQNDRRAIRV